MDEEEGEAMLPSARGVGASLRRSNVHEVGSRAGLSFAVRSE